MIKIDSMSGKHFEGKTITVSAHAEEQARKKLGVSFKQAATFIRDNLRKAQYIGKIVDENGKSAVCSDTTALHSYSTKTTTS